MQPARDRLKVRRFAVTLARSGFPQKGVEQPEADAGIGSYRHTKAADAQPENPDLARAFVGKAGRRIGRKVDDTRNHAGPLERNRHEALCSLFDQAGDGGVSPRQEAIVSHRKSDAVVTNKTRENRAMSGFGDQAASEARLAGPGCPSDQDPAFADHERCRVHVRSIAGVGLPAHARPIGSHTVKRAPATSAPPGTPGPLLGTTRFSAQISPPCASMI